MLNFLNKVLHLLILQKKLILKKFWLSWKILHRKVWLIKIKIWLAELAELVREQAPQMPASVTHNKVLLVWILEEV